MLLLHQSPQNAYTPYATGAETNPHGVAAQERVIRGGRWGGDAESVRVYSRDAYHRSNRCNNAGFRVARSVEGGIDPSR